MQSKTMCSKWITHRMMLLSLVRFLVGTPCIIFVDRYIHSFYLLLSLYALLLTSISKNTSSWLMRACKYTLKYYTTIAISLCTTGSICAYKLPQSRYGILLHSSKYLSRLVENHLKWRLMWRCQKKTHHLPNVVRFCSIQNTQPFYTCASSPC
jgi:hypothetical protein